MDGQNLQRLVRQFLNEPSTSSFLDARFTYDALYAGAKEWTRISKCLRTTQSITTVADQRGYSLNGDFLGHYIKDNDDNYIIKYNDGSNDYFLDFKPYEEIIYDNDTTSVSIPDYWGITQDTTLDSQVSVAASAAGDKIGGKARLTVAVASFADIVPGDIVHNTTDVSDGVVEKVVSTTALDICLFGGTDNEVDSADAFIIQPRGRLQLVLDPPPSTASHTVTVYYLQKPAPVYSNYSVYPFSYDYAEALAKYAAWAYKYRDREPDFGDAFYQFFAMEAREYGKLFKNAAGLAKSAIVPRFR